MRRTKRSSRVNGLAMSLALLAGAAVLASVLSACAATTQGQVALQQQTPTGQTDPRPVQRSPSAVTPRCFSPAPRARPPMCTSTPTCSGATTKRSC